ncbi:hypothetical protein M8Q06_22595, partial [Enterobacter roggenkampii]|nr:hypothetical protein [Enterobacter roggenkampii]
SAQIREILISESAWEEMTCLFAPSLDKGGTFEINGVGGGGRMLISSTLIQIYDSNNVLRVRMGLW